MELNCDELYKDYSRYLYKFARRSLSHEAAEEVVQETFIKVLSTTSEFQGGCHVRTWLTTILIRTMYNLYNYNHRKGRELASSTGQISPEGMDNILENQATDVFGSGFDPLEILIQRETIKRVDIAAGMMKDCYKEIYDHIVVNNEPYEDVAARLNIPLGTVRSRVHRTRQLLAEYARE